MSSPGARPVTNLKQADRPLLDTTIDQRYFVEEQLGEHLFGTLYQARQLVLRLPVVLLVVRRHLSSNQNLVREFKTEVAEAARLTSLHAVPISDLGRVPDRRLYLTRPRVAGQTLAECLETRGPFGEEQAVAILEQVEDLLTEMHAAELVHGSLNPGVVLLTERRGRDVVRVLDVGCSTLATACEQASVYASPEQLRGDEVGAAADVYALSLIACELVTGHCSVVEPGAPPELALMSAAASDAYREAVAEGLSPDPRARPPSARVLVDGLARASRAARRRQVVVMASSGQCKLAPSESQSYYSRESARRAKIFESGCGLPAALGRISPAQLSGLLDAGVLLPKPATRPHRPDPAEAMTLQTTLSEAGDGSWIPVPSAEFFAGRLEPGTEAAEVSALTVPAGAGERVADDGVAQEHDGDRDPGDGDEAEAAGLVGGPDGGNGDGDRDAAAINERCDERSRAGMHEEAEGNREAWSDVREGDAVFRQRVSGSLARGALALAAVALVAGAVWLISGELVPLPEAASRADGGSFAVEVSAEEVVARGAVGPVASSLDGNRSTAVAAPTAQDSGAGAGTSARPTSSRRAALWRARVVSPDASPGPAAIARGREEAAEEEVQALLDAARKAYVAGIHEQALAFARRLLRLHPDHREALQIVGVSACNLADARTARKAYQRLEGRRRALLLAVCNRAGVELEPGSPATIRSK